MVEQPKKDWTPQSAIEELEECSFECVTGPLDTNHAFKWLKGVMTVGPEFWPGQRVWYKITTEVSGHSLEKWARYHIVGCHLDSDDRDRFWRYDLSDDPPGPWHHGSGVEFTGVHGNGLSLEKPL